MPVSQSDPAQEVTLSGNIFYAKEVNKLNYPHLSWQFMVVRGTIWKTELDLRYQVTQPLSAPEKAKTQAFIQGEKNAKQDTRFSPARPANQLRRGPRNFHLT